MVFNLKRRSYESGRGILLEAGINTTHVVELNDTQYGYTSLGTEDFGLLLLFWGQSKALQELGLGPCIWHRNDWELKYYLYLEFGGSRPNFVPLGPIALNEVSLDSSRRVLYNDTLFGALGPSVWPMPVKCTLAKTCNNNILHFSYKRRMFLMKIQQKWIHSD
jgi:hypothetical protein